MAELDDKLNSILGNPEAMGQIMAIAKALSGEGAKQENSPAQDAEEYRSTEEPPESPSAVSSSSPQPDWSSVAGLLSSLGGGQQAQGHPETPQNASSSPLGSIDPRILQLGMRLFSEYSTTDDKKLSLLTALKPFLKETRREKMDKAIQISKFARVIRVAFQLLKQEGGEEDV